MQYNGIDDKYFKWLGNVETVKLLLEHGADPDAYSLTGTNPRLVAAEHRDRSFQEAFKDGLVSKKQVEQGNDDGGDQEKSAGDHSSLEGLVGEETDTNKSLFG